MYPIICKIGPFTIYSYGLMLAVAFLASSTLLARRVKGEKISADIIFNLAFIVFISGIVGARIFYIIENIRYYSKDPFEIFMLQRGGLSWFGGLILSLIFSTVYLKNKKLPIYKTFDLIAPYVSLAQAIGRIGCLLNGCCFGRTFVPIQIYSSLSLIIIFFILRFLQDKAHKAGQIFFTYLLLYSLKRFFIEFWRADNPVVSLGLTSFQIISIVVFCFSLIKLIAIKRIKT